MHNSDFDKVDICWRYIILMPLVQNYVANNKRLYVIFVDMIKCFDSVYSTGL